MTTQSTPARAATGSRDRYFDVLRFLCILWVVVYHIFSTQAWLGFWPAMGLLFAISGSLMVRSLDRGALQTIKNRLQRLLPVLWLAGLIGVPLMFWHGWPADERPPLWRLVFWIFPLGDPPGSEWGASLTEPLWYMRSIVWFILLSPLLLILFRWYPKTMIAIPLAVMVGVAFGKIGFGWGGELAEGALTDGFTFLSLWLLGFAHREGMLKKIPVWAVVTLGLVLAGVATFWALTHQQGNSYDFNLIPAGQAIYSFGIVLILLRFAPKFSWVGRSKALDRTITIINGRAMVIYLWHNVAIELSYPVGDKINVWQYGETAGTAICAVIAILLTLAGMLAFGWIEDVAAQRRPQLLPKDLGKKAGSPTPAAAPEAGAAQAPATAGLHDSTVVLTHVAAPEARRGSAPEPRRGSAPEPRSGPAPEAPYRSTPEPRYEPVPEPRYGSAPEPRYDEPPRHQHRGEVGWSAYPAEQPPNDGPSRRGGPPRNR
ncbi:acyltransferase family protein [Cryptosporangium aurantiacum]|uniref:Peptidoglycan/LPS O-acetylase OafA/YrhL, contains acyltransferase and SGNH-hydrolase domains n=1 Tax=Cryptosporangium aurantiacum TaxID=134849 RepID=A0A1M7Q7G5_9ACTN|nr:acyltransferase family protein [Cryptosporangium aurantiacum]SHN26319.1 Peptidoglycan/LPS O-acetylase OafA/YrhL, contains acyltransferase and SGNH-hydrolase domains [Cryptosporangium aurantiacum]